MGGATEISFVCTKANVVCQNIIGQKNLLSDKGKWAMKTFTGPWTDISRKIIYGKKEFSLGTALRFKCPGKKPLRLICVRIEDSTDLALCQSSRCSKFERKPWLTDETMPTSGRCARSLQVGTKRSSVAKFGRCPARRGRTIRALRVGIARAKNLTLCLRPT